MAPRGDTRVRMIEVAYGLFRAHGFHGTSLADVTTAAGLPRGSFSFHFPGGKSELAHEVVALAGRRIGATVAGLAGPGGGVGALFDAAAQSLRDSDFGHGCAVAGVALDLAGDPLADLARECGAALTTWGEALRPVLRQAGVAPADCARVARLVIMLLEGALVMARAQRDTSALAEARDAALEIVSARARAPAPDPASGRRAPSAAASTRSPGSRRR